MIIFLILSGVMAFLLSFKTAKFPRTPATKALILLFAATALWSIAYAIELGSTSLEDTLFGAKVEYFGIVTIPVAWLLFSISYAKPAKRFSFLRGRYLALWIIPGLTLIMVLTNSAHELIWSDISLKQVGSLSTLTLTYGAWFWINFVYSYALLLTGTILLVGVLINSIRIFRWNTLLVLFATGIPWIANILYIFDSDWLPDLDFTPFAFFISCLLMFFSLYEFNSVSSRPNPRVSMVESLMDGLLMLDPRDNIIDLNNSAGRIIGRKGEKLIGKNFSELFPNVQTQKELAQSTESKSNLIIDEGSDRQNYHMVISSFANQESNIQSKFVVLHKIEPQDQQVRTNGVNGRIEEIINLEPDAMLLVNQKRDILLANNQAEEIFGYKREELYKLNLDVLVPEQFRSKHRSNVSFFFTHPRTRRMGASKSLFAIKKDGSKFPVDISLTPLNTGDELLVGCAIRDISAFKQLESSLQESEETYRALFEYANDAIFILSLTGVHMQVNQKAADMLGYSREELVGLGFSDIVLLEEYAKVQDRLADLKNGITSPQYEGTLRKKDGGTIPVEVNISLVRNIEGEPFIFQSIVRDISERRRAEQEQHRLLSDLKQSREDLLALEAHLVQVSEEERRALAIELHDKVGQNLTGLNLNLNIISNQLYRDDNLSVQTRLEDSIELVEETTRLVRNVMADLRPPMLDDYGLFSALRWYCDKFFQRTNIKTTLTGEECKPRLPAQTEMLLFRIVQEALHNITKYALADQVLISFSSNPKSLTLKIQDNGVGFNPAILSNPRQEFHMGLLNMQERAHMVGGRFNITTAPGEGTQILVELPREVNGD